MSAREPRKRLTLALLSAASAAAAGSAICPAHAADTTQTTLALQPIIVTAERLPESEQRTPVSVVTYNSHDLAREGVVDLESLAAADPSLQFDRNGGRGTLTIRGVSTSNTTEIGNPSVPVVIDDFTINRPAALDASLFDVQQIEVLRGPQGTLFGRSATGGIVQVTTNRPSKSFLAGGDFELGNYNTTNADGVLSVPLSDTAQVRVALFQRMHSGYRIDTTPLVGGIPSNGDDLDSKGGRVELAWQPITNLNALFIYQTITINDAGPAIQAITFNYIDPTNINSDIYHTMPDRGDGRAFPIVGSQWYRHRDNVGKLHLSYDLPSGVTLSYLGGIDTYEHNELDSGDPPWPAAFDSPAALGPYTINEFHFSERPTTQNHELRINSSETGPWIWQGGLYFFLENNSLFAQNTANPDSVNATNNIFFRFHIRTASKAVYEQTAYSFNSENQISAGVRYSSDTLHREGLVGPGTAGPFFSTSNTSSSRVTWHAGYDFTPTDHNLLYAKVDTGYKPGGFTNCGNEQQNYSPENVTNFEFGSKNRLFNDRLQLNGTAFYENYSNQQVSQWSRGCSTGMITTNAGKSRIYGLEGEATALLDAADRVNASISYLNARYQQFLTPPELGNPALRDCRVNSTYDASGNLIGQQCNLAGNTLPQSPTVTLLLAYEHDWSLTDQAKLNFRIEGRYTSKEYLTAFDFPDETQTSFATGNVFLNYIRGNWQVGLFARNVTNTTYLTYGAENSGGSDYLYAYGAPRTYGIRIQADLQKSGDQ